MKKYQLTVYCDGLSEAYKKAKAIRDIPGIERTDVRGPVDTPAPPATLWGLENSLRDTLENHKEEILGSDDPEDRLSNFVDCEIPAYNSYLAEILSHNPDLGYPEDNPHEGGDIDIFKMIALSIQESLLGTAHEWLSKAQEEQEVNA